MGNEASIQAARADEVALVQAASGDLEALHALLKQNPQLVYSHSRATGENLWHFAAQGGHAEVLKAVAAAVDSVLASQKKQEKFKAQVNHGFNQVNQVANKVISSAVALPAAIAIPMNADISINAQTRDGTTPLMAAVKAGKAEAVSQLLASGADAWKGDNTGATALHHAAWEGQLACLSVLLQHAESQDVVAAGSRAQRLADVTTNTGLTPLHYAAWKGKADVLKQLVNAGAALAAPSSHDTMGAVAANAGSTPLHLAAMKGELSIVRLMLKANAKLMALTAETGQQSSAPAASGARSDLRKAADKYGKTAATLAWDMQQSDLALILDPSTPLDQAIELAAQAAKAGATGRPTSSHAAAAPTPGAAATAAPASQRQQLSGGSSRWLRPRRVGDASVDSGPSTPVTTGRDGISSSKGPADSMNAGLQRLGLGSTNESNSSSSTAGTGGGGIFLPPPKSWKSQAQPTTAPLAAAVDSKSEPADTSQQQQSSVAPAGCSRGGASEAFGEFANAGTAEQGSHDNGMTSSQLDATEPAASGPADPPASLVCPITNELLKDPVRACDGLAYEREAIEVWFQLGNKMMPGGRSRISNEQLTPDNALKAAIAAWKAAAAAAGN